MSKERVQRRLAAILAADVVGYSRLMGEDEAGTLARLKALRVELIDPQIAAFGGRVFKTTGDGVLAEFPSAVSAVEAAAEIQGEIARRAASEGAGAPMALRIGIDLGDVIVDGDDLFGEGVNVAARLEAIAEPGAVCLSGSAHEQVRGKVSSPFADLGERALKNIARPVHVWSIASPTSAADGTWAMDAAPALPDKPSIAILPFDNLSDDPEQEYFSDGICEDVITALSRIRWFFVIARNSTFAYKGKNPDIRDVARELGVRYVVEGSVRKAGNRIRLTAQLIDGATGKHLWAERYDRALADIFDLQDELTGTLVGAIEPQLSKAEQQRAKLKKPENLDVWDIYQHGMSALHRLTAESLPEAAATLARVTDADPSFAAAFAGLAEVHYYNLVLGFTDDPDAARRDALAAARRAVALDPEDADAHCAMGRAYLINRQFDDAIPEFRATLEINPSHALAHYGLGASHVFSGDPAPAAEHLDQAIRLSPHDAHMGSFLVRKAHAHLYLEEYEEAVEWARRALRLPNFQWSRYAILCAALGHLGRIDEARQALDILQERIPEFSAQYMLDYSPILDDHHFRRCLVDGMRKAGLAE